MRQLPEVVERARELRKKQFSFNEIGKQLRISNSTIRSWCYDLGINRHESLRINNEFRRRKISMQDWGNVPSISLILPSQARIFASLLYGCEGSKYPSTGFVAFVNSDPNLVRAFIKLLRKGFILDENKFRVQMQVHNTHDYLALVEYWSKLLVIPPNKFLKPTTTTPRGKMRRQNYLGTISLRYIDNKIQLRLLGIFEKFCNSGGVA